MEPAHDGSSDASANHIVSNVKSLSPINYNAACGIIAINYLITNQTDGFIMKRITRLSILVATVLVIGSLLDPGCYAQEAQGGVTIGIEGKVINNKTRKPIKNAKVQLVGTVKKAKTDTTGTFRIANIGKGHKELRITAKGYKEQTEKINRGKDMNLYITIRLEKEKKKDKS